MMTLGEHSSFQKDLNLTDHQLVHLGSRESTCGVETSFAQSRIELTSTSCTLFSLSLSCVVVADLMTSKSKKKGPMQAVAHLVHLNTTNTETDRHSFLDRPAKTNVDISRVTDVRAYDRADTELTAARAWPKGLSEDAVGNECR